MHALRILRKYLLLQAAEGNHRAVRRYVLGQLDRFARAFQITPETLRNSVESLTDDVALVSVLLEAIIRTEAVTRKVRRDNRMRAAQASANVLSSTIRWEGDKAMVDMASLFSTLLTDRKDVLVFTCEEFTTCIRMCHLLDLAKIGRVRTNLSGWVDRQGLHVNWKSGALNLYSQNDATATQVILFLPPMPAVVAA